MPAFETNLREWILNRIVNKLSLKNNAAAYIIWCDPECALKGLLEQAASCGEFELWAEETHELLLRQKFYAAPPTRRVIWLPVSRAQITYFKAFEQQAEEVVELSLPQALTEFGVELPSNQPELLDTLPVYAREWIDYPLSHWRAHLGGQDGLLDDQKFLEILAADGWGPDEMLPSDLLSVFNRRAEEDFGLPPLFTGQPPADFAKIDIEGWRVRSVAALLCTEAETLSPNEPLTSREFVITGKAQRDRALRLLANWQKQLDLFDAFERLAGRADALAGLMYWARSLASAPLPFASPTVEKILFETELEHLEKLDAFEDLAGGLETRVSFYQTHGSGFWGSRARNPLGWAYLVELAGSATLLRQFLHTGSTWSNPSQAVDWYTNTGWKVDHAAENLFREDTGRNKASGALAGVKARLRRSYQRHLDRINTAFAALLAQGTMIDRLPGVAYAGEALDQAFKTLDRQPAAVLVLDACRFEVGCRIVESINRGEPARRADVSAMQAPFPSITALGMPLCLPGEKPGLRISLAASEAAPQPWVVSVDGFSGNLASAPDRRQWLKQTWKVKDEAFLKLDDVINLAIAGKLSVKTQGRLVFVFDAELDDHEGVLEPYGLDPLIDRYTAAIRQLRSAGFTNIFIVTDHGFFHNQPDTDEKDVPKPDGEVMWKSRRAVVGHGLQHTTAIKVRVPFSDLECCIPRSTNLFKTYGGLGFFHGGATLQELVIPFVQIRWPVRAHKIGVVLKQIANITSVAPRIQVGPQATQPDMFSGVDENLLARPVMIKVVQPDLGRIVFKSKGRATIEPAGNVQTLELEMVAGAQAPVGTNLEILVIDADDEEVLDRGRVTLQVELDDWL